MHHHLTPETAHAIEAEVKHFASDLKLSKDQRLKLQDALEGARELIDHIHQQSPDITPEKILAKVRSARPQIRHRVSAFLTPEQLALWDAEVAKAKSFLGYRY